MTDWGAQFFEISGLLGVAFYLGGYAALQLGLIRGNSLTYTLSNLFGAALVLVSLLTEFNMASAIIQISWIVISLTGLARMFLISRRLSFTAEETEFLQARLPDLSKASARTFLDAGTWTEMPKGHELLREGEPVGNLFYLSKGEVLVSSGGQDLAHVTEGYLGEINVLSGTPASATATTNMTCRVFAVSREALLRLQQADGDFRLSLESSLSRDTGRKLVTANKALVTSRAGAAE